MTVHDGARLLFALGMLLAVLAMIPRVSGWPLLHVAVFLEGLAGLFVVGV
jgi:hypothetical protein